MTENKVVVTITDDNYYDVDLGHLFSLLPSSESSYIKHQNLYWEYSSNLYKIQISHRGAVKLGIEFSDRIDLIYKTQLAFEEIDPLIKYFENRYKEKLLSKLLFSWTSNVVNINDISIINDKKYKQESTKLDNGHFYSQLTYV